MKETSNPLKFEFDDIVLVNGNQFFEMIIRI